MEKNIEEKIEEYINKYAKQGINFSSISCYFRNKEFIAYIEEQTKFLNDIYSKVRKVDRLYCYVNAICEPDDLPICKSCGKNYCLFDNSTYIKFKDSCSMKCGVKYAYSNMSNERKQKALQTRVNTVKDKYGVDNISKLPEVLDKIKETTLKKYGSFKKACYDTAQKTIIDKYGVDNVSKSENIKLKKEQTRLKTFTDRLSNSLKILNLEMLEDYSGNREHCNFRCTKCNNTFTQSWFNIQQGFKCVVCFPRNLGYSSHELDLVDFLKQHNINNIVTNTKNVIPPIEIDVYLPDYGIAIEMDGLYYHTEKFGKTNNYHLNKTVECENKNIRLIHIFEDEWLLKKDIVKNRLLHILNKNTNTKKIYARNCNIDILSVSEKNDFLNKYHLQGTDTSVVKLGALYANELVAVMTFSHGNISKGSKSRDNIWELNRYCCSYEYIIPGIASKLLKHFKDNYEWETIFSYADRRWSNGNLYNKIGFKFDKYTQPNYWYVKNLKRIHRFNLRKKQDDPENVSESVLRSSEGYHRIWDCGSIKFTMEKDN